MESIKEENVKLSREVVTTVPNTWLVEATNPATGQTKMIDIANYAAVVAGILQFPYKRSNAPLDNIDDLSEMGFYTAAGVSWNPSGTANFGILIVISSYRTHIYIDVDGLVAVRVRSNNVWKSWRIITGDLV